MIGYLTSILFLAAVVFIVTVEQGTAMPVGPVGSHQTKPWTDQDTYESVRAALAEMNMHQGKFDTGR